MTRNTLIYITMVNRTIVIMNDNNIIWKTKSKTSEKVTDIKTLATEIADLNKQQGKSTKGATDTKNDERHTTGAQAEHVSSMLQSYYDDANDKKNLAIVKFSITDFVQSNIEDAVKNMQLIYDIAAAIIDKTPTALDVYNFEPTDLTELQADIDSLKIAVPTQSVMRSTNKTITAAIKTKVRLLRDKVNSLDINIGTYKKRYSSFVSDYTNGRRMVQTGVGHLTEHVALMPEQHEALLGLKYTLGDSFTIRNHSAFVAEYGITNTPGVLPVTRQRIEGNADVHVEITKDNAGSFGHWLVIYNPNEFDDVNLTVLVAKGSKK